MGLGFLIQGWTTHSINEIYDWRSGTDRHASPRALSGGSKVLNERLLDERGLRGIFWTATTGVVILGAFVGVARAPWLVFLIVLGYVIGLVYTLPPVATAYRPFAGEWLGGFPGVLLAGLGAVLFGFLGVQAHPAFLLGVAFLVPAVFLHAKVDPTDLRSVTRNELRIIQLGILAGVSTAVGIAPILWPLLPLAALGYMAHLAIAASPADLVRAWRRAPAGEAHRRGTSK